MLSREGRHYMEQAPWLALWPGLCLTIVVYSLNMFGDAVRDLLDPRLRGAVGRLGAPRQVGSGSISTAGGQPVTGDLHPFAGDSRKVIDGEARRRKMTRTAYIEWMAKRIAQNGG